MKLYKKIILTLVFIIPLFLNLFVFPINTLSDSTLHFNFNDEILIDSDDIPFESNYNTRNPQSFTDVYNATFSFTNDTIGSNPTNWTTFETGGMVNVSENKEGHQNVVCLNDTSGTGYTGIHRTFSENQESGFVEFFVSTSDVSLHTSMEMFGTSVAIRFYIRQTLFKVYDGAILTILSAQTPINDRWYHIKFEYESGLGAYKGLAPDTWRVFINGIAHGDFDYRLVVSDIQDFRVETLTVDSGYTSYIDGVGFSQDVFYNENDNVVPLYITDTSIIEKDKFQFDMKGTNEFYQDYDDIINWSILGGASGFINNLLWEGNDRYFRIHHTTTVASTPKETGIYYPTFESNDNKINVSLRMSFLEFDYSADSWFKMEVLSSDFTKIMIIHIFYAGGNRAELYFQKSDSWIKFGNNIQLNEIIDLNLFIDYNSELCTIRYKKNDILQNVSICNTLAVGKMGIASLKLFNYYTAFQADPRLTTGVLSAGVYSQGISMIGNNDFCYLGFNLTDDLTTIFQRHNIFEIRTSGLINSTLHYGQIGIKTVEITPRILFNNTDFKANIYDGITDIISNPKLLFYFVGNLLVGNFTVDYLKVSGSSLIESGNKYWLEFAYGNVDISNNYFYVDSNNRLQFNLTTDDNKLEYIQATFDVNNVNTTNKFLSFRSNLFGSNIGNFRLEFITISNVFLLEKLDMTYYEYISQEQIINKFVLLITDNDLTNEGSTTGYFSTIKLRYSTIETTIITLTVISLIIPLIIILLPSISISNVYSKALLVPLFILFTIISAISGLIPYWLLFIILYNTIIFMYLKQEEFSESF